MKKIKIILGLFTFVAFAFVAVPIIWAAAVVEEKDVLSTKVILVKADEMTADESYTLPDADTADGSTYIFKRSLGPNGYHYDIYPASGDKIDDNITSSLINPGEYIVFFADGDNDTWWVLGEGISY